MLHIPIFDIQIFTIKYCTLSQVIIIIVDDENTENRQPSNNIVETTPAAPVYPTRLDLQRFQKLLEAEDISTIASEPSLPPTTKHQERASKQATQHPNVQNLSESSRTSVKFKSGMFAFTLVYIYQFKASFFVYFFCHQLDEQLLVTQDIAK